MARLLSPACLLALALQAPSAGAVECAVDISGGDSLSYSRASIAVPRACEAFTIRFAHRGIRPRETMGHNWVLSTLGHMQGVVDDGLIAGAQRHYLKPDDERVLASSRMLGGGESEELRFDTGRLRPDEVYVFFCTFPGHASRAKGLIRLID